MMRALAIVVLALVLSACHAGSRAHELAALQKVAPDLFRLAPAAGALPENKWPQEVRDLGTKSVYARPEGLYLVTSSFFVQESGIFLPRSPTFQPTRGSDPEYTRIVQGVYSYSVAG